MPHSYYSNGTAHLSVGLEPPVQSCAETNEWQCKPIAGPARRRYAEHTGHRQAAGYSHHFEKLLWYCVSVQPRPHAVQGNGVVGQEDILLEQPVAAHLNPAAAAAAAAKEVLSKEGCLNRCQGKYCV